MGNEIWMGVCFTTKYDRGNRPIHSQTEEDMKSLFQEYEGVDPKLSNFYTGIRINS